MEHLELLSWDRISRIMRTENLEVDHVTSSVYLQTTEFVIVGIKPNQNTLSYKLSVFNLWMDSILYKLNTLLYCCMFIWNTLVLNKKSAPNERDRVIQTEIYIHPSVNGLKSMSVCLLSKVFIRGKDQGVNELNTWILNENLFGRVFYYNWTPKSFDRVSILFLHLQHRCVVSFFKFVVNNNHRQFTFVSDIVCLKGIFCVRYCLLLFIYNNGHFHTHKEVFFVLLTPFLIVFRSNLLTNSSYITLATSPYISSFDNCIKRIIDYKF